MWILYAAASAFFAGVTSILAKCGIKNHALQNGPSSIVAPMDKLSVIITVVFSYFVFGERLNHRELAGLIFLTAGTIMMAML